MTESVELWVPVIGDGRDPSSAYRGDIPYDKIEGRTHCRMLVDKSDHGRPHAYCIVEVPADQAHLCAKAVEESVVDERSQLAVAMQRGLHHRWNSHAVDQFFDNIDTAAMDDAGRRMVKDLLIEAVHRGCSAQRAEAIRVRKNLPLAGETQRDGR